MSVLTVICGPMFAGKTEELQRHMRRVVIAGRAVYFIRPREDTRPQGARSHGGQLVQGVAEHRVSVDATTRPHVPAGTYLVAIDEAQFFARDRLIPWVRHWLRRGYRVTAAGLDVDSQDEPFETVGALLALAHLPVKVTAVCARCGEAAHRSFRLTDETERVVVGNKYEPRCGPCFAGVR